MKIEHHLSTLLELPLAPREAVAFVQDVGLSLCKVRFMRGLTVTPQEGGLSRVEAVMPVTLPLVGPYDLGFESLLEPGLRGAKLHALPLSAEGKKGWAEVAGEAEVIPLPSGSRLRYELDLTVHVLLPEPERWGGRALLKMVELTAQRVVADIARDFPAAVLGAAGEAERAYSRT